MVWRGVRQLLQGRVLGDRPCNLIDVRILFCVENERTSAKLDKSSNPVDRK